jgi:hypothetical protein
MVLLAVVAVLAGCRGYDFRTLAVYNAPRSRFRLVALTEGTVKAGEDVTDRGRGTVVVCPLSPGARAIELRFAPGAAVAFAIDKGAKGSLSWGFRAAAPSLSRVLKLGAYPTPRARELDEAVQVIDGALAGPKGTYMSGQTKSVDVVRVDFHTSAPKPGFAACGGP